MDLEDLVKDREADLEASTARLSELEEQLGASATREREQAMAAEARIAELEMEASIAKKSVVGAQARADGLQEQIYELQLWITILRKRSRRWLRGKRVW